MTSTCVRVCLMAWGSTQADIEHAIYKAALGKSQQAWDVVDIKRLNDLPCPLDVEDRKAIAADRDRYWAYVVYPIAET